MKRLAAMAVVLATGAWALARGEPGPASNVPERDRGSASWGWEDRSGLPRHDVPSGLRAGSQPAVAVDRMKAETSYPLLMSKSLSVFPGVSLERTAFHFDDLALRDIDAYVLSLPVTARAPVTEQWGAMMILSPGWHSDLCRFDPDAFSLSTIALASRSIGPTLSVSMGAVYARVFGRERVLPAAGAVWNPSPEWQVRLMYPRPGVTYAPSRDWRIRAVAGPAGGQWSVDDPRVGSGHASQELRYRVTRAQLGVEWDVTPPLSLFVGAGAVLRRNLQLRDGDTRLIDADADPAFEAAAGVVIR